MRMFGVQHFRLGALTSTSKTVLGYQRESPEPNRNEQRNMDRLATARVGWSVGKNLTYSSLRPAKSFGLASSIDFDDILKRGASGAQYVLAVDKGLVAFAPGSSNPPTGSSRIDADDARHIYDRAYFDCLTKQRGAGCIRRSDNLSRHGETPTIRRCRRP